MTGIQHRISDFFWIWGWEMQLVKEYIVCIVFSSFFINWNLTWIQKFRKSAAEYRRNIFLMTCLNSSMILQGTKTIRRTTWFRISESVATSIRKYMHMQDHWKPMRVECTTSPEGSTFVVPIFEKDRWRCRSTSGQHVHAFETCDA